MNTKKNSNESGSALVYILIAIALLAALTVSFMKPSGQQTQSQNSFKLVSEMQSQVDLIRSTTQECVLLHTGGDALAIGNGQDNHPYPMRPSHTYFNSNCGAGESAANDQVKHLRCPGNPGDNACHVAMFGGKSGKFMPAAPKLFGEWTWYNGPDGVFIWIATSKTDPYLDSVVTKLDESYATCEADVIDASSGGAKDLDSGSVATCPSGSKCFRVWMITDTETTVDAATSLYPDETACNTI